MIAPCLDELCYGLRNSLAFTRSPIYSTPDETLRRLLAFTILEILHSLHIDSTSKDTACSCQIIASLLISASDLELGGILCQERPIIDAC